MHVLMVNEKSSQQLSLFIAIFISQLLLGLVYPLQHLSWNPLRNKVISITLE